MTQITKEAIEAGLRITLSSVNMPAGECLHETDVREILESALPFLPIAGKPDMLRLAVAAVLEADKEFRANMPPEWEGDPLSDEIDGLRRVFSSLSTLPIAVEGKVKALEFESYRDSEASAPRWKADHSFGEYRIILNKRDMEYWSPQFGGLTGKCWTSLEAAKAAAQTDYQTRILSALISSPGKDGGREDDRTEGFIAGYDEGLRQSKSEASIITADALQKAKSVLTTIRRGALAPMGDVLAALNAIENAAMDAQPASTALVERLMKALEPFCKHYEPWMERWDNQEASSTFSRHTFGDLREALAAVNEARAAVSSASREGDDAKD